VKTKQSNIVCYKLGGYISVFSIYYSYSDSLALAGQATMTT